MQAKLILVAEKIEAGQNGQVSAHNLALDVMRPSFPATLDSLDLFTIWVRAEDEPAEQDFQLIIQTSEGSTPPERVPINFEDRREVVQGISLDGFTLDKPGAYIFHFRQNNEHRGTWVLRAHQG